MCCEIFCYQDGTNLTGVSAFTKDGAEKMVLTTTFTHNITHDNYRDVYNCTTQFDALDNPEDEIGNGTVEDHMVQTDDRPPAYSYTQQVGGYTTLECRYLTVVSGCLVISDSDIGKKVGASWFRRQTQ